MSTHTDKIVEQIMDLHRRWTRDEPSNADALRTIINDHKASVRAGERERWRPYFERARAAMKRHNDADYLCESVEGLEAANNCVQELDDALAAMTGEG